jgi:ribosomal protein S27AE
MKELNFCPYCNAPQHKVVLVEKHDVNFCKECNTFFTLHERKWQCFKCDGTRIEDSDFPAPDGQIVFQCRKCKKMYSGNEFFEKCEEITEEKG